MRKNKITALLAAFGLAITLFAAGCGTEISSTSETTSQSDVSDTENTGEISGTQTDVAGDDTSGSAVISLSEIPEYSGDSYVEVNGNIPYFTEEEQQNTDVFETYSELDSLGRCGVAYANVCQELMPTEERGDISSVYPTGWEQNYYDFVDGGYIYNRSHLIAHELCAEDATVENLITGCRYFNLNMTEFENMVADYVKETDNHVLYRVTPIFSGDNLMASGVLMEGWSVEDGGDGICYCIYMFNVQPGIVINYATGENMADPDYAGTADTGLSGDESEASTETSTSTETDTGESTYVLNTNTMKFHKPDCSSVPDMNEQNKEEYTGTREELINEGYSPCGNCNP